jgi:hypothetical protein
MINDAANIRYSCMPGPVIDQQNIIICIANKSCPNNTHIYPNNIDVIGCTANGDWRLLSNTFSQNINDIDQNPSIPLLPICIGN